jgi:hypothetical protein
MSKDGLPTRDQVERIRRQYPKGTRVELVSMSDPYTTLKAGDQGVVELVDDTGTIFVNWDNGSTLGAVYGEDIIKRPSKINGKLRNQILILRSLPDCPNMFDANAVQRLAFEHGFYELVDFIQTDRKAYAAFILTGKAE